MQAGNLYINRGITGAIVQRQPFGGWKRSAVGQTSKAGGPSYLIHLMDAHDVTDRSDEAAWAAAARHSDREVWASELTARDVQDLHGEINVLRHLPVAVMVRAAEGSKPVELARVLHAAQTVSAPVEVSVATADQREAAIRAGMKPDDVRLEDAATFAARVDAQTPTRIRLIGEADDTLLTAIAQRVEVSVWRDPVTASGRIELLPFLREQAISATNHRYGNPLPRPLDLVGPTGFARGA